MKILFCNIAWMDYYKDIYPGVDEPINGCSHVHENNDANEKNNFSSVNIMEFADGRSADKYCLGFVETKTTSRSGKRNELHIEKIDGCSLGNKEESVDDVLVIYCAARPYQNFTSVVGWYKHTTVYSNYQIVEINLEDKSVYEQWYNAIAKEEDCVLLPKSARKIIEWNVPRRQTGAAYEK
jgi:hypothetical protein